MMSKVVQFFEKNVVSRDESGVIHWSISWKVWKGKKFETKILENNVLGQLLLRSLRREYTGKELALVHFVGRVHGFRIRPWVLAFLFVARIKIAVHPSKRGDAAGLRNKYIILHLAFFFFLLASMYLNDRRKFFKKKKDISILRSRITLHHSGRGKIHTWLSMSLPLSTLLGLFVSFGSTNL